MASEARPFLWLFDEEVRRAEAAARLKRPQTLVAAQTAAAGKSSEPLGDQRLRELRRVLTTMGLERSKTQITFHERFIQACALHLYQQDTVDLATIMKREGWDHVKQSCLVLTPRCVPRRVRARQLVLL